MVAAFMRGVGDILVSLFSLWDQIWTLYITGAVISSFFALWVIKRVLVFFDILK